MSIKKAAAKTAKWIATGIFTVGAIVAIGLLSYCGMLVLAPSIVLAWVAFSFAGIVDGEVYLQNIGNGIDDLKLLGKHGIDNLIIKSLDEELKNAPGETASPLIKDYYAQRNYIASLSHKKLSKEQKEKKKKMIKQLHRMQKIFVARVLTKNKNAAGSAITTSINFALGSVGITTKDPYEEAIRKKLPTLKRKIWYLRFSVPLCLSAGSAFGFATAAALDVALASIGIAAAAAVWPLAAVACIAYAFLIYYTISDMIRNDTFSKWRKKIVGWFKPKEIEDENGNKKKIIDQKYIWGVIGKSTLLILAVGLGILATLATAGTWWLAVKNGATLLSIAAPIANWIRNISVPLASAATLVFAIRNSLTSIKEFLKDIKKGHFQKKYAALKDNLKKTFSPPDNNWAFALNPFRLITAALKVPFLCLVFIGHVVSVGLIGDRAPGLNYIATIASAVFGALSDGFVDYHYIAGHTHTEKPHKPGHHHSHGIIADFMLKTFLSPLLFLSACWDFMATQAYKKPGKIKSFARSLKGNFIGGDVEESIGDDVEPKKLSDVFLKEEMEYRIDKQINRLKNEIIIDKKLAQQKIAALNHVKSELQNNKIPEENAYAILKERRAVLNNCRLFARSITTSERVVKDVITEYAKVLTVK